MSYFETNSPYFSATPFRSPLAGVTVTPGADNVASGQTDSSAQQAECVAGGGRWLSTFGGSYCEKASTAEFIPTGPYGQGVKVDEVIAVEGKAPAGKKFPWVPVLLGGGALAVILLLMKKKGGKALLPAIA